MLDLSPEKLVVLGLIAFLVLGPQRLPEMARKAGRMVVELRRMSNGFRTEVRTALSEPRDALNSAVQDLGLPGVTGINGITGIPRAPSVRRVITSALFDDPAADFEGGSAMTGSAPGAASVAGTSSVHPGGLPPVPDDPTLN